MRKSVRPSAVRMSGRATGQGFEAHHASLARRDDGWKCAMTPFDSIRSPIDGFATVAPMGMRTTWGPGGREGWREPGGNSESLQGYLQRYRVAPNPQIVSTRGRRALPPVRLQCRLIARSCPRLHLLARRA